MTNISVITSIEYCVGAGFLPAEFQSASAGYECKSDRTAAGIIRKHTLTFSMAALNASNERVVGELRLARYVRFTDVNRFRVTLGSEGLPPTVTTEDIIEGKPGSFRGVKVTVKWDSARAGSRESFI